MKVKPPKVEKFEQVTARIPHEVFVQLVAYRDELASATPDAEVKVNYVIVEALRAFLASDREFQARFARRKAEAPAPRPRSVVAGQAAATNQPETPARPKVAANG